ncbi:uncharacterized protein LOC123510877 [Portunus trituberculatus]|uniref:uncharacterized protein LOC123510877 n=1 Tax=Portunus trituberculatus TaxID=210409 RepID=UPI001E1D0230|nr:uncharacterized protein LOC123510877 [Portunus trituberculatus]XP_045122264.1 uncharacterized protein LOC123510877 [Portunus trituberculatus]XP_045122265.1 uncharacterized protein LOC123510877 [Portunus trituberculatus]
MTPRCGVTLLVMVVVAAALLGEVAAVERGPANRATRMKNLRKSNVDMKALREKYLAMLEGEVCIPKQPSPTDPPLPTVPDSFMTQVEFNLYSSEIQQVIHGVEMYDGPSRRGVNDYDFGAGVVLTRPYLKREEIHYNHNMDEALFIKSDDPCIITGEEGCDISKHCTAGKIKDMNAELQEIFGIVDTSGGGEFMGAMGLMEFGPYFNYTYYGDEVCRGARCQVFTACINKPEEGNTSLLYSYYWTTDDWNVQNNGKPVPMYVDIMDTMKNGFILHVEFFDFRREWIPALDELEPPVDVFCEGRVSYLDPPKPIEHFYYKSEQVGGMNVVVPDGQGGTESVHLRAMFPQEEWYDYEMKISRVDYVPFFIYGADRRFENLTQRVLDFNQDLMYQVRPRLNTCKISPINTNITWGDVEVGEDGSIHMMSPWNWDKVSETMQYNGQHWERGMTADVWVGVKPNPTVKVNETIVWYFASPFTNDILARDTAISFPTLDKVPIKLEKYLSFAEGLPHVIYHVYNFEGIIPLTHNHDVSLCFKHNQMRHFTFDLPANALEKSLYLRENLKYAIVGALAEAGSVSPIRINRLELNKTKEAVQVLFTLLEKPSLVADVVGNVGENTMDEAASAIKDILDASQLIILVQYGNSPDHGERRNILITSFAAKPHTMVEVERSENLPRGIEVLKGYSSGDMAGLAVGMIVAGLLMGLGGMYLYGRKK